MKERENKPPEYSLENKPPQYEEIAKSDDVKRISRTSQNSKDFITFIKDVENNREEIEKNRIAEEKCDLCCLNCETICKWGIIIIFIGGIIGSISYGFYLWHRYNPYSFYMFLGSIAILTIETLIQRILWHYLTKGRNKERDTFICFISFTVLFIVILVVFIYDAVMLGIYCITPIISGLLYLCLRFVINCAVFAENEK